MTDSLPRVLHIEDNRDIAMVVGKVLQPVASITHVSTLEEARQKLAENQYDLAIVDLVLPDGSGFDIVPELKGEPNPIPVIIHSAHEVSETVHNVDAVLSKTHTQHEDFRKMVKKLAS
jgi:DNA-binding response OmpR family regulator